MNSIKPKVAPIFGPDLSTLIWPMSQDEFCLSAMHDRIFYQPGTIERLELLAERLNFFDLDFLFNQGDEATIWKNGGLQTTRGTDSAVDINALIKGTTIQTHLQKKSSFAKYFISDIAHQMNLESGFFSIFASQDTHTVTHYDRNYNFTIQLSGEKVWQVYAEQANTSNPTSNVALQSDRLSPIATHLHGARVGQPVGKPTVYSLTPGDLLYVPPGYWHSTECTDLSISLNLSLEPKLWFQVIGDRLMRHLEAKKEWRKPFGDATGEQIRTYLSELQQIVGLFMPDDIASQSVKPSQVHVDEPLRRTLGSVLIWEIDGAGLYYEEDELRFTALGNKGRWIEVVKSDMEPVLEFISNVTDIITIREIANKLRLESKRVQVLVQQFVDFGYLIPVSDKA